VWTGEINARSSRKYELLFNWDDLEKSTRDWVRFQVEELLSHREAPENSKMASKTGVEFGGNCEIYGPKLVFLGDKMGSFYRVKDAKITQISRGYGGQRFTIIIDRHLNCGGRFAASSYQAYYFSVADSTLVKAENYLDDYVQVGEVYLPAERRFAEAIPGKVVSRVLRFSDHSLLVA
jgi:hypothetical protein